MLLKDKVVFLTGGANGIGRECALAYAREGAKVAIVDIDPEQARATAHEIGDRTLALTCDVAQETSVAQAVEAALAHFGRIDAVHNNAGIAGPAKTADVTSESDWDRLFAVNVKSVFWTIRATLSSLKLSRGAILNTASLVGQIGQTSHAAYASTKGAMIALTKCMALDYATFGIRVNAVCPAGVWTPMLEEWASQQPDPGAIHTYLDQIHALGYCPHGDVIGDAAAFLLSDSARFITGCILPVSGGAELGYRR